jgi:hypothetical protein
MLHVDDLIQTRPENIRLTGPVTFLRTHDHPSFAAAKGSESRAIPQINIARKPRQTRSKLAKSNTSTVGKGIINQMDGGSSRPTNSPTVT